MAKKVTQVKGGASSNTQGCKVCYSDAHNLREGEHNPNSNIRPECSHNNTVWMSKEVPGLWSLYNDIRKDYAEHNGRKMATKGRTAATPVRETILNLPNNTKATDAMVVEFIRKCEEQFGVRAVRYFIHRDEYFEDKKDPQNSHFNCHAHIVWDWYDHQNHKVRNLGKDAMRLMQDFASQATGMPRGMSAELTGAEHLSVMQYKNERESERLSKQIEEKRQEMAQISTKCVEAEKSLSETKARNLALKSQNLGHRLIQHIGNLFTGDIERKQADEITRLQKNLNTVSQEKDDEHQKLIKVSDERDKAVNDKEEVEKIKKTALQNIEKAKDTLQHQYDIMLVIALKCKRMLKKLGVDPGLTPDEAAILSHFEKKIEKTDKENIQSKGKNKEQSFKI